MGELAAAALLGIAAGLTPGPLHAFVISTALEHGPAAAVRVAFAPLLSDAIPLAVSLAVAVSMPPIVLRWLSVAGGVLLIWLAVRTLRDAVRHQGVMPTEPRPHPGYLAGAALNLMNPGPWLFWLGAGTPLMAAAFEHGRAIGVGWIVLFYVGLVGVKVLLALGVGSLRAALSPRSLYAGLVISGCLMVGIGVWLVLRGLAG